MNMWTNVGPSEGHAKRMLIEDFYLLGYNAVSTLKVDRRFEGTCRLQARNQHEAGSELCYSFLFDLSFIHEDECHIFLLNLG
jgi:hypothetical protein